MRISLDRLLLSAKTRTVLPALADGVIVMICSTPLWAAYLAVSPEHTLRELTPMPSILTIVTLIGYVVLTAIGSIIGIRHLHRRPAGLGPVRRKKSLVLVVIVITPAIIVAMKVLRHGFDLDMILQTVAAAALVNMPAALRVTAPVEPQPPKMGPGSQDSMREFGVEPGTFNSQGWRQEP